MMATIASYVKSLINGSILFTGNNYATYAGGAGTAMGTGDFTWECFVYPAINANFDALIDTRDGDFLNGGQILLYFDGANLVPTFWTNFLKLVSSVALLRANWNHVALTRQGTTVTIWVNGVSGGTVTNSLNFTNQRVLIGTNPIGGVLLDGYLSNVRMIKGTAIYTSPFTPPTSPLSAISGTQLLLNTYYGSNFLKDSSPNNFTATNVNLVSSSSLNPFS